MEIINKYQIMVQGIPKTVLMRERMRDDIPALERFYSAIPVGDHVHFEEYIGDISFVKRSFDSLTHEVISIVAFIEDAIIGESKVTRSLRNRSSHVGELTVYFLPEYRHQGLGSAMLQELYHLATMRGVEKLIGKIPAPSLPYLKNTLDRLGFHQEAILQRHIKDAKGIAHDLIVYSQHIAELWDRILEWQQQYGRKTEY